jgi:hypothetical protein
MNARWIAEGVVSDDKTHIKPRLQQYNEDIDKMYYKRLLVLKNNRLIPCNYIDLPKPPAKIVHEYEKLKNEWSSDLLQETANEINAFLQKKEDKQQQMTLFSHMQETVLSMLKKGMNAFQIAEQHDMTEKAVYDHMKALRKRGIGLIPVKDERNRVEKYTVIDKRPEKDINFIEKAMNNEPIVAV